MQVYTHLHTHAQCAHIRACLPFKLLKPLFKEDLICCKPQPLSAAKLKRAYAHTSEALLAYAK